MNKLAYITTIEELKTMLSSKILPFFEQEKLAVDHEYSETIHLVELPRPTYLDIMTNAPRKIKYLNSPELNMHRDLIGNKSFSKALKMAEYFIDECIEIKVLDIKYRRLSKALKQGLVAKKVYESIESKQLLRITHNGKTFPVASFVTRIYLPESVCNDLERNVGKYPDNTTLHMTVKGPASIYGGYDEGVFKKFYCLTYCLEIYAEDYTIDVVK